MEKIKKLIELYPYQEKVQYNSYFEIEKNFKNATINKELTARLQYLKKWKSTIGKKVYKSHRDFNYHLVGENLDPLNARYFNTVQEIIFTEEMYDKLEKDYINYQIERLTERLLDNNLSENSTNQLSNLMFSWRVECEQKLIKLFKACTIKN